MISTYGRIQAKWEVEKFRKQRKVEQGDEDFFVENELGIKRQIGN